MAHKGEKKNGRHYGTKKAKKGTKKKAPMKRRSY
jgi:hypothetical protein